ncbi:O-antigen flippase [Shewanella sp. Choline-02u-19]|uniref:O-antigen translocase n=1 Tax=unclassified Shewanella TaxID=196818 RepID=UPI000C34BE94|nr:MULTISPECIES: O-antigen translocase [unclassified Shewanella]PKH55678.1 O-antigen flippase [Shewanella sp. Bg11-22]PKI26907.1 O-antigen flippase [Shewanella sp. Choline-02u-19]
MNLLKTSFLTFIATAIKVLAGLVINKAVSIYIGPSGIALIGQFQNSSQIAMTVAQGGINTGVTKYTAQYGVKSDLLPKLWSTAARIVLCCSVGVGLFLIFGSKYISEYTLKTDEYSYVFITFGFTIIFFTINQLLLSILNGLKEIRTFIAINISQSIYALIFTTLLVALYGLDGALIALVTNQSIIFITVLWRLRKHKLIIIKNFKQKFDNEQGKKLLSYSAIALTSACTVPVSLLFIRDYIGENLSWDAAGYWQSMWYISSMYLMVVTTALSTYYLPRLSEITSKVELRTELKNGYLIIIPIVIVLSFTIYLLREFIIWLLFTDDFKPMIELFKWQLIGDVVKVASWLSGFLLIARGAVKLTIFSEIFFSVTFCCLSVYFVNNYGLVGMSYAYVVNYMGHLLFMLYFTRRNILY